MRKTFIVIGLGRFGSCVARTLELQNYDVMAVDIKESCVSEISADVPHCCVADTTKISVLEELDVKSIDHAVVAIGNNLQASIMTVVNLRKLGVDKITVRADLAEHKEVFQLLGADEVIIPEEQSAVSLANQIMSDSILDYYALDKKNGMYKVSVGPHFEAKSLIELDVRNKYDVNIVGFIRNGEFMVPKGTDLLSPGDIAYVAGTKNNIRKFDLFLNKAPKKRKVVKEEE